FTQDLGVCAWPPDPFFLELFHQARFVEVRRRLCLFVVCLNSRRILETKLFSFFQIRQDTSFRIRIVRWLVGALLNSAINNPPPWVLQDATARSQTVSLFSRTSLDVHRGLVIDC